ncbi:MAG TPA: hypothetical protein VE093_13380 [Polyangiaceae bacterium]|nr:hypothetical protein [Polyangiaceae bacterium]
MRRAILMLLLCAAGASSTPSALAQDSPGALPPEADGVPRIPSAVDPVTSAPSPGHLPGVSPPLLDIVAATLQVDKEGAVVKGVFAPFLFMKSPIYALSDTRVEIHGGSSALQPWGFVLSTGYSSATSRLHRLNRDDRVSIAKACKKKGENNLGDAPKSADALARNLGISRTAGISDNEYFGEVYAAWDKSAPSDRARLKPMAENLLLAANKLDDTVGDCWMKTYATKRMENAYDGALAARISFGADFFPSVEGPKVSPDGIEPKEEPVPNTMAGWNVGANFGYFAHRNLRFWFSGSYAQTRSKPATDKLTSRWGLGADLAANVPVASINADGFQPGVAVGGFAAMQRCVKESECTETIFGYKDPLNLDKLYSIGGYIDIRASAKVQLRFGLPATIYILKSAPSNSDGGQIVIGVSPTISLTVANWAF